MVDVIRGWLSERNTKENALISTQLLFINQCVYFAGWARSRLALLETFGGCTAFGTRPALALCVLRFSILMHFIKVNIDVR